MQLERDGAELQPDAVTAHGDALLGLMGDVPAKAGRRLVSRPDVENWLREACVTGTASARMGGDARPVRAVLFNKTETTNWSLGWHQDRTVAVKERLTCRGLCRWTVKDGIQHVEPPFAIIERMMTVRIHLDPVPAANAPLLVIPGSHLLGRVEEQDIDALTSATPPAACLADRGDVWWYRTAIVHASRRATGNQNRRVLQVDFSTDLLPEPLQWRGIS